MSDSIQSISQGNYILQGTVATSAGIVGDGSTQNPLRADETVLYSGTYTNDTFPSITANETIWNFERIRVTLGFDTVNTGYKGVEVKEFYTQDLSSTNLIVFTPVTWNGTKMNVTYPHIISYSGTQDGLVFNPYYAGYHSQTYSGTTPGGNKQVTLAGGRFNTTSYGTYEFGITRIVGINRISGSNA